MKNPEIQQSPRRQVRLAVPLIQDLKFRCQSIKVDGCGSHQNSRGRTKDLRERAFGSTVHAVAGLCATAALQLPCFP